jgi:hypothetical protein
MKSKYNTISGSLLLIIIFVLLFMDNTKLEVIGYIIASILLFLLFIFSIFHNRKLGIESIMLLISLISFIILSFVYNL